VGDLAAVEKRVRSKVTQGSRQTSKGAATKVAGPATSKNTKSAVPLEAEKAPVAVKRAAAPQNTDKHPVDLLKVKKVVTGSPKKARKGDEPKPQATSKHVEKEKSTAKASTGLSPKKIHKAELLEASNNVDNSAAEDSTDKEIQELEHRLASLKKEKKGATPKGAKASAEKSSEKAKKKVDSKTSAKKSSRAAPKKDSKKQRKAK